VKAPTLVVWGAEDRVIPATHANLGAQALNDTHVIILEGIGHVPQLEDPEAFVRAVEKFLTAPPG
jgi:pimeloyl-ACP methyl ester carboxylesterase